MIITSKDFQVPNCCQKDFGKYTVDISKQFGCWAVALYENMDSPDYKLLKVQDEIRCKSQAIKIANEYANIAQLNNLI